VVDGGRADGPQDAVGHRGGAWDLQEVATGGVKVGDEHGLKSLEEGLIFCIQNTFVKGICPKIHSN
jgi:hypothetical protein